MCVLEEVKGPLCLQEKQPVAWRRGLVPVNHTEINFKSRYHLYKFVFSKVVINEKIFRISYVHYLNKYTIEYNTVVKYHIGLIFSIKIVMLINLYLLDEVLLTVTCGSIC